MEEKNKSNYLRKTYLDYFIKNGHKLVKSDSLIPSNDPSLLFTSAGMVQFKEYFIKRGAEFSRAASCQKCLRTSDIDRIGYTPRHLSFFEMLGNFSFGDYFKEEAIDFAYEFLVKHACLPKDRLSITVYKDDDEAMRHWQKYFPKDKIYKLGDETNFWTMGPTGPCGPCSEIIYDMGEQYGCGKSSCDPGCDCNRWLEIWNLVFTQFDRQQDGRLLPLKQKNIDTGMGLERLVAVCNGRDNVFETDLFMPIISSIAETVKYEYKSDARKDSALRLIADHTRAVTFLISDNVLPSNEGRGYITRRLIRRAVRNGKLLGINSPFMYKLSSPVIDLMKEAYPEISVNRETIAFVTKTEEEKFYNTLDTGLNHLNAIIEKSRKKSEKTITGKDVFSLYDTYGFPAELTDEILRENGLNFDKNEFQEFQKQAQNVAKQSWKGLKVMDTKVYESFAGKTRFTGYGNFSENPLIIGLVKGNKAVESLGEGEEGDVVLDVTPFYAESGGQVGDTGSLKSGQEAYAEVIGTIKPIDSVIIHKVKMVKGILRSGSRVNALIDIESRKSTMRHHTATHLLHKALRETLGNHVAQHGSLVSPDRLRFDFTHFKQLSEVEREKVESDVNRNIMDCIGSITLEMSVGEAKKIGAMALFGEKYGDRVRCVVIGGKIGKNSSGEPEITEQPVSIELCGGTHCHNTGEIGMFRILSESSIGSGQRRIEAICGARVAQYLAENDKILRELSVIFNIPPSELTSKIEKELEEKRKLALEISNLKEKILLGESGGSKKSAETILGINVIIQLLENIPVQSLRSLSDKLKNENSKNTIIIISSSSEDKISFVVSLSEDISKNLSASLIAKEIAKHIEGSAGGRNDFAQGGGKKTPSFNETKIIELLKQFITKK